MKIDKTLSIFFVIMFMMYTYKVNAQKYDLQYHSNETILSPKQMEEDILEFYNFVLEVHPNPFNTLNPAMLDKKVHKIILHINPLYIHFFLCLLGLYYIYKNQVKYIFKQTGNSIHNRKVWYLV